MSASTITKGCVLITVFSFATVAFAQVAVSGRSSRFYRPRPPLPPELGFSYDHASTALEGALRGAAEYWHGLGSYWLALSQAYICREKARALAVANRERIVSDKIAMREWLEADRQRRIAERRATNLLLHPTTFEVYRLGAKQLDRTTGTIVWPTVLRNAEYSELRNRLDSMFRDDACGNCRLNSKLSVIARCVDSLKEELRRNRAGIKTAEWLAASKFLSGVSVEAEFPIGAGSDFDFAQPSGDPRTTASGDRRTTVVAGNN
jgi:hypothetical protein